ILTRIVKLHFTRPVLTDESRAAADTLSRMDGEALSHFLLLATRKEAEVLARFHELFPQYEAKLRRLGDTCFCCGTRLTGDSHRCSSCQSDLVGHLRIERIVKNHAMFLALLDCLALVVAIPEDMVRQTQRTMVRISLERQAAISADNPVVTEFWQVYDYLESMSSDPVVNHSDDDRAIAINLNEFIERAAEHRQRLADLSTLRELLKDSRQFRYLDNKVVTSRIRKNQRRANPLDTRPDKVRCWVFANPAGPA
ncbi:MAG TPA: bifunctional DNA primase/helicase, partial [Pseudomonas sp.]|nr:bifunctional DNA primase/helicase [Pseudomonas sp.]